MKHLFETVELPHLRVKNRLVRSATWEGIARPDGGLTEETFAIYDELARGGVGAIITGFTSVAVNDRYFGGMMRLSDDALIPQYKELVECIHTLDCPVLAQLALGAYYRPEADGGLRQVEPDDMTAEEVHLVRDQFIQATLRARKAGFDGVQVHAAHFFFLSRFISPAVNHRTDQYGGTPQKRTALLVEILRGIREQTPELHVSVKINSNDFTFGGLDEVESLRVCKILAEAGIDAIEVSGNGTSVAGIRPRVNEGYFAPFAARLAREIKTPVILVGGMRSREKMEEILNNTDIALISLSRPLLREPDLPELLRTGQTSTSRCVSCNRCYGSPAHRCVFRNREGQA